MTNKIETEARTTTRDAGSGISENQNNANDRLHDDAQSYNANDYGSLLKDIKTQNEKNTSANSLLPKLELTDSKNSGSLDKVTPNYDDGKTRPAGDNSGKAGDNTAPDRTPPATSPLDGKAPDRTPPATSPLDGKAPDRTTEATSPLDGKAPDRTAQPTTTPESSPITQQPHIQERAGSSSSGSLQN